MAPDAEACLRFELAFDAWNTLFLLPIFSRAGYVTLFVLTFELQAETPTVRNLYVLQRDNAYDADTKATMKHIQTLYAVDTTVNYELPLELKSDYILLCTYCKLATTNNHCITSGDVEHMRDKAVHFCTALTRNLAHTLPLALKNFGLMTRIYATFSMNSSLRLSNCVRFGSQLWEGS